MTKSDAVQTLPPATMVALHVAGISLQDLASIVGIVLLTLQLGYFVWDKFIRSNQPKRRGRRS